MEYLIALIDGQGNHLGYYVSDDQEVSSEMAEAEKFSDWGNANDECSVINGCWDLPKGESFVVIEFEHSFF